MKKNSSFLKPAVILTLALVVICVFMPEWGLAQIIIIVLVALLAAFQWFLFFYLRNDPPKK